MYELSLTALVEDHDVPAARSIIGGLCGMPPWETTARVLYFQGPSRPTGLAKVSALDKPVRKDTGFLWKELHQSLVRQSFVLQARYEVTKEQMGDDGEVMNLDSTPGVLRWTDFPDPAHGKNSLTQRKKIEIWDQRGLVSLMRDNEYQFKTETVEEMDRFFRDELEFCLTRQYFTGPIGNYAPLNAAAAQPQAPTSPAQTVPAWHALTPIDQGSRWILQVKIHVVQDNKPDEIRRAQDALMTVRNELDGVFDFQTVDRKVFDTRVALQQHGVQALPQKVTLGKG